MRTTREIVEDVKDGGRPTYDEIRFALLVLDSLIFFARGDVMFLYDPKKATP